MEPGTCSPPERLQNNRAQVSPYHHTGNKEVVELLNPSRNISPNLPEHPQQLNTQSRTAEIQLARLLPPPKVYCKPGERPAQGLNSTPTMIICQPDSNIFQYSRHILQADPLAPILPTGSSATIRSRTRSAQVPSPRRPRKVKEPDEVKNTPHPVLLPSQVRYDWTPTFWHRIAAYAYTITVSKTSADLRSYDWIPFGDLASEVAAVMSFESRTVDGRCA